MVVFLNQMDGSVARSVYSHFHAPLRTVFAHWGGRLRTVLMRIAAAQAPRRWA